MKRTINFLGWAMLVSVLLSIVLVITAVSMAGSMDPMTIRIDGDTVSLAEMGGFAWLFAIGGIALALLIVALIVPFAVLIPLAIVAVALVGVMLMLVGVFALVFSPLIFAVLAVWLIVRLIRRSERKPPVTNGAASGATITG